MYFHRAGALAEHVDAPRTGRLAVLAPPYEHFSALDAVSWSGSAGALPHAGFLLVWQLEDAAEQESEFESLLRRPPYLPLAVVLPDADRIERVVPLLYRLELARPRIVLPSYLLATPARLRYLVAHPPQNLPEAVVDYLEQRRVGIQEKGLLDLRRVLEMAPTVRSISSLSRHMYVSRRTLGRQFKSRRLPTPSHCLQFARLIHVAVRLQRENAPISRVAIQAGYPDGFTLSNQMKRILGERPSVVRERLGWEWVVESWLRREGLVGGSG